MDDNLMTSDKQRFLISRKIDSEEVSNARTVV